MLIVFLEIGHEKAQSVIDSITSSYAAEGQAGQNPMLQQQQGPGGFGPPPPFGGFGGSLHLLTIASRALLTYANRTTRLNTSAFPSTRRWPYVPTRPITKLPMLTCLQHRIETCPSLHPFLLRDNKATCPSLLLFLLKASQAPVALLRMAKVFLLQATCPSLLRKACRSCPRRVRIIRANFRPQDKGRRVWEVPLGRVLRVGRRWKSRTRARTFRT